MGPLDGVRVVELRGLGPGPFGAMVLSDLGADVLRVGHPGRHDFYPPHKDVLARGRRSVALDLKSPRLRELVMDEIARSDILIDPFRPGVAERLLLGPDQCLALNPRLIYGRITGWGQKGPYANRVGHDINYAAIAGALYGIGPKDRPLPPLNLVADFGGGGMLLVLGILAALYERERSGRGQVIDAAMVDGVALLMASICGFAAMDQWTEEREANLLDGGAPYYGCYETLDGEFVSIGPIEERFYLQLLERLGLDQRRWPQERRDMWPALNQRLRDIFLTRTRDDWCAAFEGSEACFAPVLRLTDAFADPHIRDRATYVDVAGITQPAPAPRFSRTPGSIQGPPALPGQHTRATLAEWGVPPDEIELLIEQGLAAGEE